MASVVVVFDGRCYRAHKSGGAGFVFGDTRAEALRRAALWHCTHTPTAQGTTWEKKKRKD